MPLHVNLESFGFPDESANISREGSLEDQCADVFFTHTCLFRSVQCSRVTLACG